MLEAVEEVRRLLREKADPARAEGAKRFFKEDQNLRSYGVTSAEVKKIAKRVFAELKGQPREAIYERCGELWRSGMLEEGGVACEWAHALRKGYEPGDFAVFESWVDNYVANWAACDSLCMGTVGAFMERYPEFVRPLKEWTASANRWKKRAAAVSLVTPARKGLFLEDVFAIADRLLTDGDDMVQKGYGWLLKVASQRHPEEVFAYLMRQREVMPRTAFRYALEKLPKDWRNRAMRK